MHVRPARRILMVILASAGAVALAIVAGWAHLPRTIAALGGAACGAGAAIAMLPLPRRNTPSGDSRREHHAWVQRFARTGAWFHKPESDLVRLTPEHLAASGLDPATPLEMPLADYLETHVHPEDRALVETWLRGGAPEDGDASGEISYRTVGAEGMLRYLRASWIPIGHKGRKLVATQDITDRKRLEERLLRGVLYDALTGLPNRVLFDDRVSALLGRPGPEFVGVALMDLDRFLAVNASLGRDAGDALLLGLAVRLVGSLPPGTTVARVGEDEFAVLLEVSDPDDGMHIAEAMRQALASPLVRGERPVSLTASVGLVLSRRDGCHAEALLQKAETALFQARNRGGDAIAVFDERQGRRDREEVSLGLELRQAAVHDELELHYQPVVSLVDHSTVGFEALVRWRRPGVGLVPPGMFIPLAELNGAITDIGLWVLNEGMAGLARWNAQGWPISMAINLSPRQMEQDDVVEQVREALERHGVVPERVKLEITETALSGHATEVAERVARIRALGVRISLDDFGTGYSSLGHLHRFPVDTLKIDKSFVDMLGVDGELSPVPRAVVGLAHSLGMEVVAEGIESPHQLARLKEMGCEMGQGYLFSRPLPHVEAEEWLRVQGTCALVT